MSPPTTTPDDPPPLAIDAEVYPHIIDAILDAAPYATLLRFRRTCRALRTRVDNLIVQHLLFFPDKRVASRRGPQFRLPFSPSDSLLFKNLMNSVRIIDAHPELRDMSIPSCFGPIRPPKPNVYDLIQRWKINEKATVLRTWGIQKHTKAKRQVLFTEPSHPREFLSDIATSRSFSSEQGYDSWVIQLPIPPSYRLSSAHTIFITSGLTGSRRVVFRRRSKPVFLQQPLWSNRDARFASALALLFEIRGDRTEVILVDFEAKPNLDPQFIVPKKMYSRTKLVADLKARLHDRHPELEAVVDTKLIFLTTDEYRESIGEAAWLQEEDDHGFKSGPQQSTRTGTVHPSYVGHFNFSWIPKEDADEYNSEDDYDDYDDCDDYGDYE